MVDIDTHECEISLSGGIFTRTQFRPVAGEIKCMNSTKTTYAYNDHLE